MNDAHLHLIVNHFPIIGIILGVGILISGMILKNKSVINTAFVLFVISAIFAALSMATGEGAEEMVENLPNIGKPIIHEHEEMAEKLAVVSYFLGLTSMLGLFFNLKNKSKATLMSYLVMIIAILAVILAQQTGTTGGEIRHTEIRTKSTHVVVDSVHNNDKIDQEENE